MASVVVNGGKQQISGRFIGATPTQAVPSFLQWGTGAGTAAVTDTGLFSTTGTTEARVNSTVTQVTGAQTNSKVQFVGTITAAGSRTITEVALFDGAGTGSPPTGANFFEHSDHGSTALATGDAIQYTIQIDFTP